MSWLDTIDVKRWEASGNLPPIVQSVLRRVAIVLVDRDAEEPPVLTVDALALTSDVGPVDVVVGFGPHGVYPLPC